MEDDQGTEDLFGENWRSKVQAKGGRQYEDALAVSLIGAARVAAVLWVPVTFLLFSWYVASFESYNRLYGSLGAGIGFMVWIWLSVVVILIGAELNAEMEHQTARDTTAGGRETSRHARCSHGRTASVQLKARSVASPPNQARVGSA